VLEREMSQPWHQPLKPAGFYDSELLVVVNRDGSYEERPGCPVGWTLDDAKQCWAVLDRVAHQAGYLLAIYGSVLRGWGTDLDLLAVPWRPSASDPETLLELMAAAVEGTPDGPTYEGSMDTRAVVIQLRNGRLIDVQVRGR
jgi:hypothetical protein